MAARLVAADEPFSFVLIKGVTDTSPRARTGSFSAFSERFKAPVVRKNKQGEAFIAAKMSGRGRADTDVESLSALVLDIDAGNLSHDAIASALRGHRYFAHTTHSSTPSNLRWRVVILFARAATAAEYRASHREFAKILGADPSGASPSHIYFLPSVPPGRKKDFVFLEGHGAPIDPDHHLVRVDFSPQIAKGERNTRFTSIGGAMRKRGMSATAIEAALLAENEQLDDPLPTAEVRKIAKSVGRYEAERTQSRGAWSCATVVPNEFERYVIHGVLPEAGRVVLYGPAGSMKTVLAIDMMCHIALGRAWHERDIDIASKVAYVATENPTSVKRRFRAWALDHKVPVSRLDRELFVWDGSLDLNSERSVADFAASIGGLIALANGVAPRIWVIDTLATAMSGDENTKAIQDAVQSIYHAIKEAIGSDPLAIFIHHTGKDETREERGHSSLRAVVDTAIRVEVGQSTGELPTKEEPAVLVKHGIATIAKQRDGIDGQQFAFEVHSILVGFDEKKRPRSQAVVRHADDLDAARREIAAKKERGSSKTITSTIREAFDELVGKSGEVAQKLLLDAVAEKLDKSPEALRNHFSRDVKRAGFTSTQTRPGASAMVRRR